MNTGIRLAYYGDDFTGSTDTLACAVSGGWRAALFLSLPTRAELDTFGQLDCVGVAGSARAMTPAEMARTLPEIFRGLAATGAAVVHYKTCSTFDSAPHIGSIGDAIRIAQDTLGTRTAMIVGGQPNLGRYCAFSNLFARAGDGRRYRIDRHPTMSRHPVTPMGEADLRLHLARQGLAAIEAFDLGLLDERGNHGGMLAGMLARSPDAVLFDVMNDTHLAQIGSLIRERALIASPVLAVGASSVLQAVMGSPCEEAGPDADDGSHGPAALARVAQTFVVAGSRSPETRAQIECAEGAGFASVPIDPQALVEGGAYVRTLIGRVVALLRSGQSVVAHSTFGEFAQAADSARTRALAIACGDLMQEVVSRHRLERIGFAGGDTSSLAVQSWGIRALTFAARLSPGVAVCRIHDPGRPLDGVEIMLKGGQMGAPDIFPSLLGGIKAGHGPAGAARGASDARLSAS